MKLFLSTILFIFVFIESFSQYETGYVVKAEADTVPGLINHKNWDRTPRSVSFKKGPESEQIKFTVNDLVAFRVANEIYRKAITNVDHADYKNSNSLTPSPLPEFSVDTVFLQLLFKAELSLYYLKDIKGKMHFFLGDKEDQIVPLIYKKYTKEVPNPAMPDLFKKVIAENEEYKRQLYRQFKDLEGFQKEIEATQYTAKSLMGLFRKYYEIKSKNLN